jgi:hypothetical protein
MILEDLRIERQAYGADKGKFKGSIRFSNDRSKIEMALTHDVSEQLLKVVGDCLVESAKELAMDLTADCINALPEPAPEKTLLSRFRGDS